MAIKLTYGKVVDEVMPALAELSNLKYPKSTPMSHHLDVAENLEEFEKISKRFWDLRNKTLEDLADKDKKGSPVKEINEDTGESSYKLSDQSKILWGEKLNELKETEVSVNVKKLNKGNFAKVEGLRPISVKGILVLLKDK
jgi:hypothetical protein